MPSVQNHDEWNNQIINLQACIDLYSAACQAYDELPFKLSGKEHLLPIYEPSARELVTRTEENLQAHLAQLLPSVKTTVSNIEKYARLSETNTLDIRIEPRTESIGTIGMLILGRFLSQLQSLVYSLIEPNRLQPTARVRESATLHVRAFAPGSFVVRVQEREDPSLWGDQGVIPFFFPSMKHLIDAADDIQELKQLVRSLGLIPISRYHRLLRILSSEECSVDFNWASPSGKNEISSLTANQIYNILSAFKEEKELSTRQFKTTGRLVMLEKDDGSRAGKFRIISDNASYMGTADRSVVGSFVPSNVKALLEETIEVNQATDEEKISYHLLEVQEITKPE